MPYLFRGCSFGIASLFCIVAILAGCSSRPASKPVVAYYKGNMQLESLTVDGERIRTLRDRVKLTSGQMHRVEGKFSELDRKCSHDDRNQCYSEWSCLVDFRSRPNKSYSIRTDFGGITVVELPRGTVVGRAKCNATHWDEIAGME